MFRVIYIHTYTTILQKLCGPQRHHQCFQKERLGETQPVPPTLKAMITFVSATYYLFFKAL